MGHLDREEAYKIGEIFNAHGMNNLGKFFTRDYARNQERDSNHVRAVQADFPAQAQWIGETAISQLKANKLNNYSYRMSIGMRELIPSFSQHPTQETWMKDIVSRQTAKVENADMIRVAAGMNKLLPLIAQNPSQETWMKEVVAQQIEAVKNGDMIRVAAGLENLVTLISQYPAHEAWIKQVVENQIANLNNGDMIRIASGIEKTLVLVEAYPDKIDQIKQMVDERMQDTSVNGDMLIVAFDAMRQFSQAA